MNLENVVRDINDEQSLLFQLHRQLIDASPFPYRKVVSRFIHDNHSITKTNGSGEFVCLFFSSTQQRDLVFHIDALAQTEIADHLGADIAQLFLGQKPKPQDSSDQLPPQEIIPRY